MCSGSRCLGVDLELGPDRVAGAIEALAEDAGRIAVLVGRIPDGDEAAVAERHHRRRGLVAGGKRVELELATQRVASGVEDAAENAQGAAVGAAVVVPGDDKATALERRHRRP